MVSCTHDPVSLELSLQASILFRSGPPLSYFLLSSVSIQRQCTLDLCSIVPFIVGSEIYPPLAKTCLNLRSDFNSTSSWEVYCIGFILFYFIFKLYNIVIVLPNIEMNLPQVYPCSPSWTLLPPPSPYHPSGLCQCTSPKHPVSCIEPGLATCFIYDIIHVSMPFSQISPPLPQSP